MTTGEIIKERRKALGLTQDALAKKMGYKSREAISSVERNKEDLTTDRIRKYAEALDCTPAYLMGWESQQLTIEDLMEACSFDHNGRRIVVTPALMENIDKSKIREYSFILSKSEANIINQLRALSETGKNKLLERLQELLTLEGVNDKVHASTEF